MTLTTAPAITAPTATSTDRARYRSRARRERITYLAAAPLLAIGPQLDAALPLHAAVAATGASSLLWLYYKARPPRDTRLGGLGRPRRRESDRLELETSHRLGLLRASYRATPVISGAALYLAALAAGTVGADLAPWWQYGAPAAWAAAMAAALPRTRAPRRPRRDPRELIADLERAAGLQPTGEDTTGRDTQELPAPRTYEEMVAWHWETAGVATGCHLADIRQLSPDRPDFTAVVVAPHGKTVPHLTPAALAAVWDLPEGTVTLDPLDGHGPGHKLITARPTLSLEDHGDGSGEAGIDPDLAALWRSRLAKAGGPLEGVQLLAARIEPNRIAFRVRAAGDEVLRLPHRAIARALEIDDIELVGCATNGMGDGIVSVYEIHPLLTVREATVEDLTMDERGEIAYGLQPDGRIARTNIYRPELGAINDLYVGAPGAGKSVALNTLIIAERISGVVSIVADAQDGMSLPECEGRVAHFGKGLAAVGATLAATYAVAKYRQAVSSDNGWGSFAINNPWRLVNITLDELNLILAEEADVPPDFKKWVLGLITKFQATGRKMGIGLRFAAQGINVADLGDKSKVRANAKTGTVWLGRTTSGTTASMAADGILPRDVEVVPIPATFGGGDEDMDAAFEGRETPPGPTTAGMANMIRGGRLTRMRVWRADKDTNKQYPHLINLYESAPIPYLTPEEQQAFDDAYADALDRAERLLTGDDDEDDDHDDGLDAILNSRPARPAAPATVPDQIRDLLATHGPLPLRDIRAALPGIAPGTVGNTVTTMHEAGDIVRAGRGVYALPS